MLSILDSICPCPLRLTRLFLLPAMGANCHKRNLLNQQEVSQWLKHLECYLVLSSWQLGSSDSFPELALPARMGCRCCLASSWSIPRTALCISPRARSSSSLQCQEQEPLVCGFNCSELSMRSSPSSDS